MSLALPTLSEDLQPGIKVAELLRVSTEEQADETRAGLARQKAVNERTILTKGLTRVVTIELHVSGTVMVDHPQLKQLLAMITRREIQGVVCADLDRLFRPDNFHSYSILQTFQDYGARIYTGDSVYDLQTSNGLLQSSIRSAIAGFELSLIRERLHGAKEAKRKAGKFPSCWKNLPFGVGYDRKTETWHYTPEIVRVKELFDRFEAGERNYSALGKSLGILPVTVKNLLRNPIYTGWRIIDQKRGAKRLSSAGKHYRVKIKRAPADVIRVKVLEGIISEERHAAVLKEIAHTKFNFIERYRSSPRVHICSGFFACGFCGQPMYLLTSDKAFGYLQCRSNNKKYKQQTGGCRQNNLREDHVEKALIELVEKVLTDPVNLGAILEQSFHKARQSIIPLQSVIDSPAQLAELTSRDKRLLDAFELGVITVDELRSKRESLRRQRKALESTTASREDNPSASFGEQARHVVKAALRFTSCRDRLQQKAIIAELIREVHVRDRHIVAFVFRQGLSTPFSNETVTLPEPLLIGPLQEDLPDGHKRCIKCSDIKPQHIFAAGLNICRECRAKDARLRRLARKAKAKNDVATGKASAVAAGEKNGLPGSSRKPG